MNLKTRILAAINSSTFALDNNNIAFYLGANEPSVRRATKELAQAGQVAVTTSRFGVKHYTPIAQASVQTRRTAARHTASV